MRKLISGATALCVVATLGFYATCDYAAAHPHSVVCRSLTLAYDLGLRQCGFGGIAMRTDGQACPCAVACKIADGVPDADPSEQAEPVESIRVEPEPCPDLPDSMPMVRETEEPKLPQPETPPATMPYAPEDAVPESTPRKRDFWSFGFEALLDDKTDTEIDGQDKTLTPDGEQSEPSTDPNGPAQWKEDPAYDHHGCTYMYCPRPYIYNAIPVVPQNKPTVKIAPKKKKPVQQPPIERQSMRPDFEFESANPHQVDTMDYRPREDGPALPNGNQPF